MQAGKQKKSGSSGIKTYLFSRTLAASPETDVTLVVGDGVEFVRR